MQKKKVQTPRITTNIKTSLIFCKNIIPVNIRVINISYLTHNNFITILPCENIQPVLNAGTFAYWFIDRIRLDVIFSREVALFRGMRFVMNLFNN